MSTATISDCGLYRYDLTRSWARESELTQRLLLWIMLNPSTADADQDDPTIRRCIGFSKREGYDGLVVVNLCGLRATDPRSLLTATDAVGPENHDTIERWMRDARIDQAVAAWGAFPTDHMLPRTFVEKIAEHRIPMACLGRTKKGAPRHPLYVRSAQPLEPFRSLLPTGGQK